MAAPSYENPIYAAYLARYNIYDDTLPVMNKDALKEWQDFSSDLARYAKDKDAQGLKERIEDKKLRLGYIKASQDFKLGIEKIMSGDRQASLKAFVDRNNNLTTNSTKIATTNNQYNSRAFEPAKAAFNTATGNTGPAASAEALFRTMTDRGIAYDASKPEVAGLAAQWATMVLGKSDIQSVSPEEAAAKVKDAGGSESLQRQVAQLISVGKQADVAVRSAQKQIDDSADYAKRLSAQGGEVTQAEIDALGKKMVQAELGFQFLVGRSPEELSADVESLKSYDSQYQMMLDREKDLRRIAFGQGKEGLRSRMGRIVSDPDFQLWAKDNGYELGQAMIDADGKVVYVPGPQDEKAILRFAYQARTGKQSPWPFASNDTGELVKVTITNDAERQRILERSDLGGGRYAVNTDDNSLVDPKAYNEAMKKDGYVPQGVKVAMGEDGVIYATTDDPDLAGKVYKYDTSTRSFTATETAPKGLEFADAAIVDANSVPQHYLTPQEFLAGGLDPAAIGFVAPEEVAALQAKAPYKVVGADQLKGLGVQTFEGLRDKRNASTMGQMGPGAFSINNGQFKFGKDSKYEVLLSDAEKTPAARSQARRARKAQRELEGIGAATGMPTERVLDMRGQIPAERPVVQPELTALAEQAMQGPATQARMEMLDTMGVATKEGTAAAPSTTAAAPAAAPAAARETTMQMPDGSVVKMTDVGIEQVTPAPGQTPAPIIPIGAPDYEAAAAKIVAEGTVVPAAPKAPPMMMAEVQPVGRPTPEVTAEGSGGEVTRIDYGARRPTLGQRIGTGLERLATTVGGAFRRGGAEGEAPAGETKEQADARRKAKAEAGTEEAVELTPGAAAAATEAARNLGSEPVGGALPPVGTESMRAGVRGESEALARGADTALLEVIRSDRSPANQDISLRAYSLLERRKADQRARDLAARGGEPAPAFDAEADAKEARAIADEARRRNLGSRTPSVTTGGRDFREGAKAPAPPPPAPEEDLFSAGTSIEMEPPEPSAPAAAPKGDTDADRKAKIEAMLAKRRADRAKAEADRAKVEGLTGGAVVRTQMPSLPPMQAPVSGVPGAPSLAGAMRTLPVTADTPKFAPVTLPATIGPEAKKYAPLNMGAKPEGSLEPAPVRRYPNTEAGYQLRRMDWLDEQGAKSPFMREVVKSLTGETEAELARAPQQPAPTQIPPQQAANAGSKLKRFLGLQRAARADGTTTGGQ